MTEAVKELEAIKAEVGSLCEGNVTHHEWCGCQIAKRLGRAIEAVKRWEEEAERAEEAEYRETMRLLKEKDEQIERLERMVDDAARRGRV